MEYVRFAFTSNSRSVTDHIGDIPSATRQNIRTLLGYDDVPAKITSDVVVSPKRIAVAIEIRSYRADRGAVLSFDWEKRAPSKKYPLGHEIYQRELIESVRAASFEYTRTDSEDYDRAKKEMRSWHSLEVRNGPKQPATTHQLNNQEPPAWMQAMIETTRILLTIAGEKHPNRIRSDHFPITYDHILARH